MKKRVLSKIRSKISTEVVRKAAEHFDKSPDLIYKIMRGDRESLEILDFLITEAKKEQDAFELKKREIEEKALSL